MCVLCERRGGGRGVVGCVVALEHIAFDLLCVFSLQIDIWSIGITCIELGKLAFSYGRSVGGRGGGVRGRSVGGRGGGVRGWKGL